MERELTVILRIRENWELTRGDSRGVNGNRGAETVVDE